MRTHPYFSRQSLDRDITKFASDIANQGYDLIAGVPRSGMVVASRLATFLGVPLATLDEEKGIVPLGYGHRMQGQPLGSRVLVIEDSCATGRSITKARQQLIQSGCMQKYELVHFAAIYASSHTLSKLDIFHKEQPLPHWFEWNWPANSHFINNLKVGTDWDGVLNRDFTAEEDDDGEIYAKTMREMLPNIVLAPHRFPIIITARLEKYRPICMEWLDRYNMSVKHLVMGPWRNKEERRGHCIGSWKAALIDQYGVGPFFESDIRQARVIAQKRQTKGAVICPPANISFEPEV